MSRHHKRNYGGRHWDIDMSPSTAVMDNLRHVDELMREYAGRSVYGAVAYLQAEDSPPMRTRNAKGCS